MRNRDFDYDVIRQAVLHAHRLRSRYMARVMRKALRALLVLPALAFQAIAAYWRSVEQPSRMNGDRLGFGNRR